MSDEPKQEEMKGFMDPDNYRTMSIPFNGADEANAALTAFFKDLIEIRKKHHIRDVHVVTTTAVKYDDGKEGDAMWSAHLGSSLNAEPMLAFALGQEQAERREQINKLLAGKKRK